MSRAATARTAAALTVLLLVAAAARAEQSWSDPGFAEMVRNAEAIVEAEVIGGGQFTAVVRVRRRLKGSPPDVMTVTGFNVYEWNAGYYVMRTGDRFILFLQRAGGEWSTPTPTAGKYPVDREYVVGSAAGRHILHETPYKDFVAAVGALAGAYGGKVKPADALAILRPMLRHGPLESRHLAVETIGNLGSPGGIPLAMEVFAGPNKAMRIAAARALGRIGGPKVVPHLIKALEDPSDAVAREAAMALAEAGEPGAAEPLRGWLSRTAEKVGIGSSAKRIRRWVDARIKVLEYIGEKAGAADLPALEGMLASGEPAAALVAVSACVRLRALTVVPKLIRLSGAEDRTLAAQAMGALYTLTVNPDFRTPDKLAKWWKLHAGEKREAWVREALDAARRIPRPPDTPDERMTAVTAVVSRSPDVVAALGKVIFTGEGWGAMPLEELRGPLALPILGAELGSESSFRRVSALRGLSAFVDEFPSSRRRVSRLVAPLVLDSSGTVATEAMRLLGECGEESVLWPAEFIVDRMELGLLSERKVAVEALRSMTGRRFGFSPGGVTNDRSRAIGRWRSCVAIVAATPRSRSEIPLARKTVKDMVRRVVSGGGWDEAAGVLAAGSEIGKEPGAVERELLAAVPRRDSAGVARVASTLALLGGERSGEKLRELLGSPDALVRVTAALAAGLSECKGMAEALGKMVESGSVVERNVAVLALGLVGDPEGSARLARMLAPDDEGKQPIELRRRAAAALAYSRAGGRPPLVDALRATETARAALVALVARGEDVPAKLGARAVAAQGVGWDPTLALGISRRIEKGSAAGLADVVSSGNLVQREAASYMLSLAPHPAALPVLRKALGDSSATVRSYAASCLGKLCDEGSAGALAKMLEDSDSTVRVEAALALGEIGDRGHYELLKSRMAAWYFIDYRSYLALGALGGRQELEGLVASTKSQSWNEQFYSMEGLARTGVAEAAERLAEIWSDSESQFQAHAGDCLVRMGKAGAAKAAKFLESGDAADRARAARLLARMKAPVARSALKRARKDTDERVRVLARLLVESGVTPAAGGSGPASSRGRR